MNIIFAKSLFFLIMISSKLQAELLDNKDTGIKTSNTHISELSARSLQEAILGLNLKLVGLETLIASLQEVIMNKTMPVGFIYVQLPKEKSPKEIWPQTAWKDVSSEYANLFFRVEGNKTAAWGVLQEDSAPRIVTVQHTDQTGTAKYTIHVPSKGWSDYLYTGDHAKFPRDHVGIRFDVQDVEVKPRNMAMRIWKRIG